ncbi:MAG: alpha-L-fucosidase, partial [Janthinobacterium lividum]
MTGKFSRRTFLHGSAATAALASAGSGLSQQLAAAFQQQSTIAPGPFQPSWQSLAQYKTPEWFRDAKFGIWAHWSAQCVPEQGDWFARRMYMQGDKDYDWHLKNHGHSSKFGFMQYNNLWKAEQWQPEKLMELYQAAG